MPLFNDSYSIYFVLRSQRLFDITMNTSYYMGMRTNQKQYPSAKTAWEKRSEDKVVAVRLDPEYRQRLAVLAEKYGSQRRVVEAGIDRLLMLENVEIEG